MHTERKNPDSWDHAFRNDKYANTTIAGINHAIAFRSIMSGRPNMQDN